ncbi:DUF1611 domain-containing protein [Flagellimonas sp.]|uniref:DUF1611 domain-containing protein n=1 Tax=Flagellimonas sp. TaxID=2058762 RepID=UPI003B509566
MKKTIDGKALIYCEGAFNTPNGKTAHGLVRFTERYEVVGIVDSKFEGQDAGEILDGKKLGIPIFKSVISAAKKLMTAGNYPKYLVIGLAPDGGRLPDKARTDIKEAIDLGWNIDSGLHDFLSDDRSLSGFADDCGVKIRDIRKTPPRNKLHFFSGEIEKVDCLKLAILGTDSAIGKRTTAWLLVHALRKAGKKAEMIGTGQTAWMQGAKYGMIMDSCINDFVSGEIEHAIVKAYNNENPDVIVIEGQGSLMNPAYPGGFEILAAGRPDYVILQHAPTRKEYDGFPGYKIHPLKKQINTIQTISGKKVIAITVNHEGLAADKVIAACQDISIETGLPAFDVLKYGAEPLVKLLKDYIK